MNLFKVLIVVQLFYAFCMTALLYAIPTDASTYVTRFSDVTEVINLKEVGSQVEDSLQSQTSMPVVELGALVFYSGNLILDLLLNFIFAIPQMLGLIVAGLTSIFALDIRVFVVVELFGSVVVIVMYVMGLIELISSLRAGTSIS